MMRVLFPCSQVLLGLGAALLSDDNHLLGSSVYRPIDLRKVMAVLIIQRALKRNLQMVQAKSRRNDMMLDSQHRPHGVERRSSCRGEALQHKDIFGRTVDAQQQGSWETRLTLGGWASLRSFRGFEGFKGSSWDGGGDKGGGAFPAQTVKRARGREHEGATCGSLVLPPDKDESRWIMQRFLLDLRNKIDHEEDAALDGESEAGFPRERRGTATLERVSPRGLEPGSRRPSAPHGGNDTSGARGNLEEAARTAATSWGVDGQRDRRRGRSFSAAADQRADHGGESSRVRGRGPQTDNQITGRHDSRGGGGRQGSDQGAPVSHVVRWLRSLLGQSRGQKESGQNVTGPQEAVSASEQVVVTVPTEDLRRGTSGGTQWDEWEGSFCSDVSSSSLDDEEKGSTNGPR